MTDIEPRFFDTENKVMAYLEWEAVRCLILGADGRSSRWAEIRKLFPEHVSQSTIWADFFLKHSKDEEKIYLRKIRNREFDSLDAFYDEANKLLKPKKKGKALKDAKHRTAQASYQREQLGDAFIEDKPELFKDARDVAKYIADTGKNEDVFSDQLSQLVFRHKALDLTDTQIQTLWNFLDAQVEKHLKLDRVEAAILDEDNKSLYFMWGKIKREHPKGDTFVWPVKEAAAKCKCSKSDVGHLMKTLEKLGAITLIQAGKAGKNSGRAALYRRDL